MATRSRKEIEKILVRYLDRHATFPHDESYQFDIKVPGIDIPDQVRERLDDETIDLFVDREMENRLVDFAEGLKERFPWIADWGQAGRMGGWLVLATDDGVLNEHGEIPARDTGGARRRLGDLQEIQRLVYDGINRLRDDLESLTFWSEGFPDQIRPPSRKHWDPRETQ